jgi:hypothetical protein
LHRILHRIGTLAVVAVIALTAIVAASVPASGLRTSRLGTGSANRTGGRRVRRRQASLLAFALVALAACDSTGPSTVAASTSPSATVSVSETPRPPLVGQWALKKTCDMIVQALTKAGLENLIPLDVGETLKIPENAPLPANWDPSHPCADAKAPYEHSHTFWPDGEFNSYDQDGQEVDNGPYTIVNDRTFFLGTRSHHTTFHYRIRGDTIMFDVVIPKDCSSEDCLGTLAWAFSVANPGQTWTRVTSGPNAP